MRSTWRVDHFGQGTAVGTLAEKKNSKLNLRKIRTSRSPFEVFRALQTDCEYAYLLESLVGPRKLAEFSYIGYNPGILFHAKGNRVNITDNEHGVTVEAAVADPLDVLRRLVSERQVDDDRFRLTGGAVGYISYDAVRCWEALPNISKEDLNFPNYEFGMFTQGLVFDHVNGETYYYSFDSESPPLLDGVFDPGSESIKTTGPESNVSKERFQEMVTSAKEYIASGDIFQVVLSRRLSFEYRGGLLSVYENLRRINPSPYMYFLKMGSTAIIGSSPEMLVRVQGGRVETFPIAGTRPRTGSEKKDDQLGRELLLDPKERAEHVMLVDLARNDLGVVCEHGTVKVPEFMRVHGFSHVQHIVSHVTGTLRQGAHAADALRAVFPAGTVSGAPKIRAMEIIEELEPCRRGPYAGAVGYFSYNGSADFAITIRTFVADQRRLYLQAGAGIVADSVPESEFMETEHKMAGLMQAVRGAGGE